VALLKMSVVFVLDDEIWTRDPSPSFFSRAFVVFADVPSFISSVEPKARKMGPARERLPVLNATLAITARTVRLLTVRISDVPVPIYLWNIEIDGRR
jgi:hypothetical protein